MLRDPSSTKTIPPALLNADFEGVGAGVGLIKEVFCNSSWNEVLMIFKGRNAECCIIRRIRFKA